MVEELFFEVAVGVAAVIAIGFGATVHEFRKYIMSWRKKDKKKDK